jgi:hypothetical protein
MVADRSKRMSRSNFHFLWLNVGLARENVKRVIKRMVHRKQADGARAQTRHRDNRRVDDDKQKMGD